jgi:predicted nicotinamide N-methyase
VLCKLLEDMDINSEAHVLELGCGTGVCGILASRLGCKVTLTDRNADLAMRNIDKNTQHSIDEFDSFDMVALNMPWEGAKTIFDAQPKSDGKQDEDLQYPDNKADIAYTVNDVLKLRGPADIVIGAEITCLGKQQGLLVEVIAELCAANPSAVVLLSFDGPSPPNACRYEAEMVRRMKEKGFCSVVGSSGLVSWQNDMFRENTSAMPAAQAPAHPLNYFKFSSGSIINTMPTPPLRNQAVLPMSCNTVELKADIKKHEVVRPGGNTLLKQTSPPLGDSKSVACLYARDENLPLSPQSAVKITKSYSSQGEAKAADPLQLPPVPPRGSPTSLSPLPSQAQTPARETTTATARLHGLPADMQLTHSEREETEHHVLAFFLPRAVNTCSRCHQQFFNSPSLNSPRQCRHHSGYYVCRRHPGDTKCSVSGLGDGLGYYGNGVEDWRAEFWDCCGSEDRLAPPCCAAAHVAY